MPLRRKVELGAAALVLATVLAVAGAGPAAACSCAVIQDEEVLADADGSDDGFAGELVLVVGFLMVGTVAGVVAARLARRTRA